MYDHDSLLLYLEPGRREASVSCKEKTEEEQKLTIPAEVPVVCSEPNVSILDLAEYRFDDGEWNPEEEILRIDNKFRKILGYPLRMEALAQPWINDKEEGFEHTLSLRYTICADSDLKNVSLRKS